MKALPRGALRTILAISVTWAGSAAAECTPGLTLSPDAAAFEVEGPIGSYSLTPGVLGFSDGTSFMFDGAVTTLNTTVYIPPALPIIVGNNETRTLQQILDPNSVYNLAQLDGLYTTMKDGTMVPVVEDATFIATGTAHIGSDNCLVLIADEAEFQFAEHVVVGPLAVDTDDEGVVTSVMVGNTIIEMNLDPRVPSVVRDISGNPLPDFSALTPFTGTLAAAEGYFDRRGAEPYVLRGIVVETEAFVTSSADQDTVVVEDARWRADKGELRVRGFVTVPPERLVEFLPTQVLIFANTSVDSTNMACIRPTETETESDFEVGTADLVLDAGQYIFGYRARGIDPPAQITRVCVETARDEDLYEHTGANVRSLAGD